MSCRALMIGAAAALVALAGGHAEAKLRVVTSTSDLASIAAEVGGDLVEAESIAQGRQDPHFVELLPSYMVRVRRADVYVKVGMDLDYWAQSIIDGSRNAELEIVDASAAIPIASRLEVPTQVDASMGDVHKYGNPHYWLDPANGKLIAKAIAAGLGKADPGNAAHYEAGAEAFAARVDAKLEEWKTKAAPLRGMKIVTYHKSWPYFTRAFGIDVVDYLEPKPGVKPSPAHVSDLIATIKAQKVAAVAYEPYFESRTPEMISRETGVPLIVLPPSVGGVPEAKGYLALFDYNIAALLRLVPK